jgi:hypothetical protein
MFLGYVPIVIHGPPRTGPFQQVDAKFCESSVAVGDRKRGQESCELGGTKSYKHHQKQINGFSRKLMVSGKQMQPEVVHSMWKM